MKFDETTNEVELTVKARVWSEGTPDYDRTLQEMARVADKAIQEYLRAINEDSMYYGWKVTTINAITDENDKPTKPENKTTLENNYTE